MKNVGVIGLAGLAILTCNITRHRVGSLVTKKVCEESGSLQVFSIVFDDQDEVLDVHFAIAVDGCIGIPVFISWC